MPTLALTTYRLTEAHGRMPAGSLLYHLGKPLVLLPEYGTTEANLFTSPPGGIVPPFIAVPLGKLARASPA